MSTAAEIRVRRYRQRAVVRAWQYRQRHHAHGVWFRLRRLLTGASAAYAISLGDVEALLAEGFACEPVAGELASPRVIVVVPEDRVARLASAQSLPVGLGAALLAAEYLVLTPFARNSQDLAGSGDR